MSNYILAGKEIHPIGIGTWDMGSKKNYEEDIIEAIYDEDQKYIDAMRYSLDHGQNHIDGAMLYGSGHTDEIIGQAIKGYDREKLLVASKIWPTHYRKTAVIEAIKITLARMQIEYLDLMYLHYPSKIVSISETMEGLSIAIDQGLIKSIGVSNFNLEQLKEANQASRYPIVANQLHYNLLHKDHVTPKMIEYCQENDIKIIAYKPVARKLLADQCNEPIILELAKKYNCTPAQLALSWILKKGFIPIPKATSSSHIDENIASIDVNLSDEDIEKLGKISNS